MNNIKQLRSQIPLEVFEEQDLHLAWRNMSLAAQHSLLSRFLKKGDVKKVSRGLYVFDEFWRKKPLSKFIIANKLLAPSYISFESALSHHGLIPEAVYATTSACVQRGNKSYHTMYGDFLYQHVPIQSFALEIESKVTAAGPEVIATPIKALFDLIYVRRKHFKNLTDLESDLRINRDEVLRHAEEINMGGLEELAESYRKKTCLDLLKAIKREMR